MPTVDFDGWVKQDHFHLKAFYTDRLRGIGIVGYQLFDQMEQQMPASSNRIWKLFSPTPVASIHTFRS